MSVKILGSLGRNRDRLRSCNRNESLSQRFRSRLAVACRPIASSGRSEKIPADRNLPFAIYPFADCADIFIDIASPGLSTLCQKSRKIAPHANDLAACRALARDTWATYAYNHAYRTRSIFIFRIFPSRRAFSSVPSAPKLVLRSAREAVPSAAGKVTVPLSRVPGLPDKQDQG